MQNYHCTNVGICTKANERVSIELSGEAEPICPEPLCQQPLSPGRAPKVPENRRKHTPQGKASLNGLTILGGLIVLAAICGFMLFRAPAQALKLEIDFPRKTVAGERYQAFISVDPTSASGVTLTSTPLPPGLTLDSKARLISGTPLAPGISEVTISAECRGYKPAASTIKIVITPASPIEAAEPVPQPVTKVAPRITPPEPVKAAASYDLVLTGSNTIGGIDTASQKGLARDLVNAFLLKSKWPGGSLMEDTFITAPGKEAMERIISYKLPTGDMKRVLIQPHGSGTSEEALRSSEPAIRADIGMSSTPRPKLQNPPADWKMAFNESVIALDAVAVIVNPENPATELTLEQLREIFGPNPSITNWSAITEGQSAPIHTIGRDNKSGTTELFRAVTGIEKALEALGKKKDAPIAFTAAGSGEGQFGFEDTAKIIDRVRQDRGAIGFVGRAANLPDSVRALSIRPAEGYSSFAPNGNTIRTREYCMARELYFYTRAEEIRPLAADFLRFCLSDEGQAIADEAGFVGFTPGTMLSSAVFGDRAPQSMKAAVSHCDRLVISFTFRHGSSLALDTISAQNLRRLTAFLHRPDMARRPLVLVGCSDSIGAPDACRKISRDRAETFAKLLENQGVVNPIEARLGFGKDYLLYDDKGDPNSREAQRNRRVDVYVAR